VSSGSRRSVPLPSGWDGLRGPILARDPSCRYGSIPEDMYEPGRCQAPSTEVDHIGDPDDHRHEMLRGLCTRHHNIRTSRQAALARNATRVTRKRPPESHPGFRRD
jgi:hypothetical protein